MWTEGQSPALASCSWSQLSKSWQQWSRRWPLSLRGRLSASFWTRHRTRWEERRFSISAEPTTLSDTCSQLTFWKWHQTLLQSLKQANSFLPSGQHRLLFVWSEPFYCPPKTCSQTCQPAPLFYEMFRTKIISSPNTSLEESKTSTSTDSSSLSETTKEDSSPQKKGYHTEHKNTFLNFEFNSVLYLQAMNLLWNQLLIKIICRRLLTKLKTIIQK